MGIGKPQHFNGTPLSCLAWCAWIFVLCAPFFGLVIWKGFF